MKPQPFSKPLRSKAVLLPMRDIDTDQIIPARFLKTVARAGLGAYLFADWRYTAAGDVRPEFVLNQPSAQGAHILVAGANFGCGSSREHAAWALADFGFQVVVSSGFADIFRNNALKNGIVPIVVSEEILALLLSGQGQPIQVDLAATTLTCDGGAPIPFEIDAFARYRLLHGMDELDFLLQHAAAITSYEQRRA